MWLKYIRKIGLAFLLSCLFIAGCGFKLRNSVVIPPALRVIYIKTCPYNALLAELRQNFCALGIRTTRLPCQAPLTLNILSEKFLETRVTISATSLLSQYLLAYEVVYQFESADCEIIVPPRMIRVTRNYTVNANQILGASNELPLLQEDMRREVVYQLINQLSSACVLNAIKAC
jgi:LPS-assembly lipoprotein